MPTQDSQDFRDLISSLLPGLCIDSSAVPSGQRVVYYAEFSPPAPQARIGWGPLVVKVTEQQNARQIAYLQKEVSLLKSLKSPYYPKLFYSEAFSENPDNGEILENRIFISVEERISAHPLSICSKKFSNEETVSKLLRELVDGLDLLWSKPEKIVHRDIKPANILVRSDESIVIIDLGIVREEGAPGLTYDEAPWGPCSPPYASPEQAINDKKTISFKSDFFSLGTLAYELLTGRNPFISEGNDRGEVLQNVQNFVPTPLVELGLSSQTFSDIINKLMRKQPFERFRTVKLLKEALKVHMEGQNDG